MDYQNNGWSQQLDTFSYIDSLSQWDQSSVQSPCNMISHYNNVSLRLALPSHGIVLTKRGSSCSEPPISTPLSTTLVTACHILAPTALTD